MYVTRCVCRQRTFIDLLAIARRSRLTTVEALAHATGATAGCGSCRPYVAAMLATGATCFSVPTHPDQPPRPATPPPGWEP